MTTKLYRPVGEKELALVAASGFKEFPPRLAWQPIFYPVLQEEYAIQIAREWNANDEFSGYAGHVLAFEVDSAFLSRYKVQNVGAALHDEFWIPAEDLALFNENIIGVIVKTQSFYGEHYLWNKNGRN